VRGEGLVRSGLTDAVRMCQLLGECSTSGERRRPPQRKLFTKFLFAFSYSMILSSSSLSTFFDVF